MRKNELKLLFRKFLNERISQIEEGNEDEVSVCLTKLANSGDELQNVLSTEQIKLWNTHDNQLGELLGAMTDFWYKKGFVDGLDILDLLRECLSD